MRRIGSNLGIEWEVVPATDAASPGSHRRSADPEGQFTPTEVACFLSHRRTWSMIADGDDPLGAVFEDDIHCAPDLKEFLQQLPAPDLPVIYRLEASPLVTEISRRPDVRVGKRALHRHQGGCLARPPSA
ncbi:glycosyl transferase family 25 [Hoeflea marina]|uniref:Glycosyl transferase family 25 n=1 Tax=Hoeflea marina TaxID=274592 RepID=A0A317PVK2_9HYPH|nr:glycosyltransferase family 25 protein [Hoeflea marina]PWW04306.1 glycosyl transferase family 25 [Hoeflea marina]